MLKVTVKSVVDPTGSANGKFFVCEFGIKGQPSNLSQEFQINNNVGNILSHIKIKEPKSFYVLKFKLRCKKKICFDKLVSVTKEDLEENPTNEIKLRDGKYEISIELSYQVDADSKSLVSFKNIHGSLKKVMSIGNIGKVKKSLSKSTSIKNLGKEHRQYHSDVNLTLQDKLNRHDSESEVSSQFNRVEEKSEVTKTQTTHDNNVYGESYKSDLSITKMSNQNGENNQIISQSIVENVEKLEKKESYEEKEEKLQNEDIHIQNESNQIQNTENNVDQVEEEEGEKKSDSHDKIDYKPKVKPRKIKLEQPNEKNLVDPNTEQKPGINEMPNSSSNQIKNDENIDRSGKSNNLINFDNRKNEELQTKLNDEEKLDEPMMGSGQGPDNKYSNNDTEQIKENDQPTDERPKPRRCRNLINDTNEAAQINEYPRTMESVSQIGFYKQESSDELPQQNESVIQVDEGRNSDLKADEKSPETSKGRKIRNAPKIYEESEQNIETGLKNNLVEIKPTLSHTELPKLPTKPRRRAINSLNKVQEDENLEDSVDRVKNNPDQDSSRSTPPMLPRPPIFSTEFMINNKNNNVSKTPEHKQTMLLKKKITKYDTKSKRISSMSTKANLYANFMWEKEDTKNEGMGDLNDAMNNKKDFFSAKETPFSERTPVKAKDHVDSFIRNASSTPKNTQQIMEASTASSKFLSTENDKIIMNNSHPSSFFDEPSDEANDFCCRLKRQEIETLDLEIEQLAAQKMDLLTKIQDLVVKINEMQA